MKWLVHEETTPGEVFHLNFCRKCSLTRYLLFSNILQAEEEKQAKEELDTRKRTLANIRFIGELFKLKMLTENIIHQCVVELLRVASLNPESMECLSCLLTTVGKELDHEKAKVGVVEISEYPSIVT